MKYPNGWKVEAFLPSDNHWTFNLGLYREPVTKAQLQYVLLHCADPIYRGELHTWEHKYRGAGVYDLFISFKPSSSIVKSLKESL